MPPAPPVSDAAREALRLGHALQLRFFQQPVFDVERFLLRQADVFVDAVRAAHHVDRVDVELAGDARGGLVLRERQHAHARDQVDDRVGVAHLRRRRALAALVVGRVIGAVIAQGLVETVHQAIEVGRGRVEVEHEGTDLGAQEMVRARGAQRGQRGKVGAADEFQHRVGIVEVAQLVFVLADLPAQQRHQARRNGGPLLRRQRRKFAATEHRLPDVRREPVLGAPDDRHGRLVARPGGIAPGEQAMAFEDDALQLRLFLRQFFQFQAQVVARTLPRQPAQFTFEDLLGQRAAVLAGGDRDHRVRVHVVDVLAVDVGVQRGVDRCGARVQVERAVRQVADHLVLEIQAAVAGFQRLQLVHVQGRKAVQLDRTQVAARPFHPQHLDLRAAERIGHRDLGRRIAAAEIRDAQVRTEQVGTVQQQFRLAQRGGVLVVPARRDRFLALRLICYTRHCTHQNLHISVVCSRSTAIPSPSPAPRRSTVTASGHSRIQRAEQCQRRTDQDREQERFNHPVDRNAHLSATPRPNNQLLDHLTIDGVATPLYSFSQTTRPSA